MPAITDHESFPQPDHLDKVLWRYIDLAKLVAMLSKSELYLAQLRSLDDPFEGKYPEPIRLRMLDAWRRRLAESGVTPSAGYPADNQTAFMRSTTYVNCWCMQPHELAGMWRIYGGSSGVAIRTTYRRLAEALPSDVFIGQVRYIEPQCADWSFDNSLDLAMFKRHFFHQEVECRVVKWIPMGALPSEYRDLDSYPKGERLAVDVSHMVNDVMTSPLAPEWFHKCVAEVVHRFAPGLPVLRSMMMP